MYKIRTGTHKMMRDCSMMSHIIMTVTMRVACLVCLVVKLLSWFNCAGACWSPTLRKSSFES